MKKISAVVVAVLFLVTNVTSQKNTVPVKGTWITNVLSSALFQKV